VLGFGTQVGLYTYLLWNIQQQRRMACHTSPTYKENIAYGNNYRTYAVARLCASVACSNPRNSALGPARNC
jgi:hypothetical protein